METNLKNLLGILLITSAVSLVTFSVYSNIEKKHDVGYNYFKDQKNRTIDKAESSNSRSVTPANLPDFTEAAAMTVPAVVHIRTSYMEKNETYDQYFGNNPFWNFFFNHPDQGFEEKEMPVRAWGSGVIISEDGFIVTNNHVVQDADTIQVTLNNKRSYKAKIVGTDPSTDIAVIKIDAKNLPYLVYGNSDILKVGQWVLAVGNPYNLTSTVTAGIVSAKARDLNILGGANSIESFIQTDAPVNPGNSGGALVNLDGELVGINAAIASNTGSFAGYAFAVPVNIVKKVVDDIIKTGVVQRGFLGIQMQEINSKLAEDKKLDDLQGVYVHSVMDNSAAQEAGIKNGDVITKLNGISINSTAQVLEIIGEQRPGNKIEVTLNRDGKQLSLNVTLKNKAGTTAEVKNEEASITSLLGATFTEPSANELQKLGINHGLQINKLENGRLKKAGIKEGFIITSVDHQPIDTVSDLKKAVGRNKDGLLIEGVYPNGMRAFYGFGLS
jgi:serine protease Do